MTKEYKVHKTRTSVGNYILGDFVVFAYWTLIISTSISLATRTHFMLIPLYVYCCLLVIGFILPKPPEGRFPLQSKEATIWFFNFQFGRVWTFPPIKHLIFSSVILRTIFLRACGAKVSMNIGWSTLSDVSDPYMLAIEDHTIIGLKSIISGHIIAKGEVILQKITIKQGATIGGNTLVTPGVYIGKETIIEPNCLLLPNSHVPDYSYIGADSVINNKMQLESGKRYPPHLDEEKLKSLL